MKKNGIQPAVTMAEESSAIFPPATLCDLLTIAEESESKYVGMFKSTATAFISFVGRTAQGTPIDLLHTERDAFTRHLRAGKYTPASVKSYMNYVRMLLKLAVASGWSVPPFAVPNAWQAIWDALKNDATRRIVRYAIQQGKKPKNFSEDDLANWRLERARMGMSLGAADGSCSQFRSSLSKANLAASLPLIRVTKTSYGVRMSEMDPRLRLEIERLLEWKVSAYQPGRAANAQVRPITAKALSNHLCRMVGFVQNILGHAPLTSLRDLVTSDLMHSYVKWTMNDRKLQAQGVIIGLGMLQAAMSQNPGYKDLDLGWLTVLSAGMPFEEQLAIDERKARKYILFSAADAIPSLIRKERLRHKQMKPRDYASSVRDELLMQWLIVLPWRQRNIRECRISGKSPNLVREPISPFSQVTQPTWIKEREKIKPGGTYWQIRFSKAETKTGHTVHIFLPFDLIALLEEYLTTHRDILIGSDHAPETLFVTNTGDAMNDEQIREHVKELAVVHAGRPTTPHLFRDIVAFEWLTQFPEDYLTLSKMLWHRNVATTLKIYGRRFDESSGVARMDNWRTGRLKAA